MVVLVSVKEVTKFVLVPSHVFSIASRPLAFANCSLASSALLLSIKETSWNISVFLTLSPHVYEAQVEN
jgi:hypothetical protein